MRPTGVPHRYLFDLHDRGIVALPDDLITERAALQRLLEHTIPSTEDPARLHRQAIDDLLAAAHSDGELSTRIDVAPLDADRKARDAAVQALEAARYEQHAHLSGLVLERRDELISDVLRPVHVRILEEAKDAVPALAGLDLTAAGSAAALVMARADAKARKALTAIHGLATDYAALRDVWARLFEQPVTTIYPAVGSLFGWVQDPAAVGAQPNGVGNRPILPWPADSLQRLLWLAAHPEVKPWLPTPAEYDARIGVVYADGIANAKRAQWAAQAG